MALITRTVSNVGDPIVDAQGLPMADVSVSFTLVNQKKKPTDAWDTLTGEYVAPTKVFATTDALGEFSIDLWPNDRGWYTTEYYCQIHYPGTVPFLAILPSGDLSTFAWIDLMKEGVPADIQTVLAMQTLWEEALAAAATATANAADTALDVDQIDSTIISLANSLVSTQALFNKNTPTVVYVDASTGNTTYTLAEGKETTVIKTDATANTVQILAPVSGSFADGSTHFLYNQYESVTFTYKNTLYYVMRDGQITLYNSVVVYPFIGYSGVFITADVLTQPTVTIDSTVTDVMIIMTDTTNAGGTVTVNLSDGSSYVLSVEGETLHLMKSGSTYYSV